MNMGAEFEFSDKEFECIYRSISLLMNGKRSLT